MTGTIPKLGAAEDEVVEIVKVEVIVGVIRVEAALLEVVTEEAAIVEFVIAEVAIVEVIVMVPPVTCVDEEVIVKAVDVLLEIVPLNMYNSSRKPLPKL